MYTVLVLEKEMLARGMKAAFRATGQTGIFIAGDVRWKPGAVIPRGLSHQPLPDLKYCIDLNLATAKLTNANVECIAVSINTANLAADEGDDLLWRTEDRLGLVCVDPFRAGVGAIIDRLP